MTGLCDLHTHSHYSDGTFAPGEILAEAAAQGLSAVALTDHNTVAGLPEFLAAGRGSGLLAIPGVEVSAGYSGKEVHIVGLFLPPERFREVAAFVDVILRRKEESNRRLVQALNREGFALEYDTLLRSHASGNINRAVIASALLERGYIASREEAFRGILSSHNGVYQPPERLCAFEVIAFLASIQAVPVLARPFLNFQEPELRQFLTRAKGHGLAAMETVYSTFTQSQTVSARRIAREFGLKESGGSDFHGAVKPDIQLGTGRGNLAVPAEFANALIPVSPERSV